jgi:hypothetical protein
MNITYTKSKSSINVNIDGESYIILNSDGMYSALAEAIKNQDMVAIKNATSIAHFMKTKSEGMLDLVDGEVFLDGKPIHGSLGQRFIEFINAQIEITPLINFCRKLRKNPSVSSIDQLFGFLDANKHPITKDGNFIAYKKIRNDYKDFHSGTFDNSPGKVLEMPRDLVNEDPTQTCSTGLHVANWSYAFNSFHGGSGIMVEVEVDPADVVAVPIDYNQGKMRTCRYKVVKVINAPRQEKLVVDGERIMASGPEEQPETQQEYCVDCDGIFDVDPVSGELLCDCDEEEYDEDEDDCDDEEDCDECPECGEEGCDGECEDENY